MIKFGNYETRQKFTIKERLSIIQEDGNETPASKINVDHGLAVGKSGDRVDFANRLKHEKKS
jgi:hypothetical protein